MGVLLNRELKPTQKTSAGTGVAGEEVVDPEKWCKQIVDDHWEKVQQAWGSASDDEKTRICEMLCVDADTLEDQEALKSHLTGMSTDECALLREQLKTHFPNAF